MSHANAMGMAVAYNMYKGSTEGGSCLDRCCNGTLLINCSWETTICTRSNNSTMCRAFELKGYKDSVSIEVFRKGCVRICLTLGVEQTESQSKELDEEEKGSEMYCVQY
jgi:hypothetical protein